MQHDGSVRMCPWTRSGPLDLRLLDLYQSGRESLCDPIYVSIIVAAPKGAIATFDYVDYVDTYLVRIAKQSQWECDADLPATSCRPRRWGCHQDIRGSRTCTLHAEAGEEGHHCD